MIVKEINIRRWAVGKYYRRRTLFGPTEMWKNCLSSLQMTEIQLQRKNENAVDYCLRWRESGGGAKLKISCENPTVFHQVLCSTYKSNNPPPTELNYLTLNTAGQHADQCCHKGKLHSLHKQSHIPSLSLFTLLDEDVMAVESPLITSRKKSGGLLWASQV